MSKIKDKINKAILQNAIEAELPKTTKVVKYVLVGQSMEIEGSREYISARRLREYYKLPRDLCRFMECHDLHKKAALNHLMQNPNPEFIILFPREKGDYKSHLKKVLKQKGVVNGKVIT